MAGIYIHIPFCKTLCSYCDFYHVVSRSDNRAFIDALVKESAIRREYIGNEIISTVYIGGGTPSLLSVKEIQSILDIIRKLYSIEENCEMTIEMNPDDIGKDYLNDLKYSDINRISLGIQSWRDSDLKLLNRRHNVAQAVYALEETIKTGFKNVTIDLIYGIPGMRLQEWASNLDLFFL
jgi:oxygen-independent coproporphyrinogen-3 oxidase